MNDRDVRTALKAAILRGHAQDREFLLMDEFGIGNGSVRIDLLAVNHRLHGYEIKSDVDSLARLPNQVRAYSSVLDRVTLVVGYRHAYEALKMIPEWWGVKLAEMATHSPAVILANARLPRDNPSVDPNELVALLWRDEALSLLEEMGQASGVRSKNRKDIYRRVIEVTPAPVLRATIRQQLRSRKAWRADAQ